MTNLEIVTTNLASIVLRWMAPGDDGNVGTATVYDLRMSAAPITDANFATATIVQPPQPQPAGTVEQFTISNVPPNTTRHFAIKTLDNLGNIAPLSNVVQGTTASGTEVFFDTFEAGLGSWMETTASESIPIPTGGLDDPHWHLTNHRSSSPLTSLYFGKVGSFMFGPADGFEPAHSGMMVSPGIDLSGVGEAVLVYREFIDVLTSHAVVAAIDGFSGPGCFPPRFSVTNGCDRLTSQKQFEKRQTIISSGGQWVERIHDLSVLTGRADPLFLRFKFTNCDPEFIPFLACFGEGWYIDDVRIIVRAGPDRLP